MKYYITNITLIVIFLVILFGSIPACTKDRAEKPAGIAVSNDADADGNISELLASMNMYHFKQPVSAPDFELPSINGNKVRLSQFRGKVVLLNFWTTW